MRFVSILFVIFEKGDEQKKCARYFQIHKYLIFEKEMCKKTVPGILRFVSNFFLIFEKADEQKNCARYFEIRKYAFFNVIIF